jgi:hypothetical protein
VRFHAGVEQQQIVRPDATVVAHPMQHARIGSRCGDRSVADVVALDAGTQVEDALDDPFRDGSR